MRIIAGTARSLPLKTIEGLETRPTTDKIKESAVGGLRRRHTIADRVGGRRFCDLWANLRRDRFDGYPDFLCNNCKSLSCLARACCLNGCIQSKQIGLNLPR